MPDYEQIYATQADRYEYLVAHEDYEGNMARALREIRPFANLNVVEFGAGTGRLTCLLAPQVQYILACDISAHMLAVAQAKLQRGGWHNWSLAVGDNRAMGVAENTADLTIAGWSFSNFAGQKPASWVGDIGSAVDEMQRITRPGGLCIIIETLGTNQASPQPPAPYLADYYRWLEQERGFHSTWIRTDYRFPSVTDAVNSVRFFFGDTMANAVQQKNSPIVPECTGIWWRVVV
jgi:ubiquinone/menaquinone biosynthesis C-methylase UbiE